MIRFKTLVLGILLLLAGNCSAIEIIAPTVPIQPGWAAFLQVSGLTLDTIKSASVDWSPKVDSKGTPLAQVIVVKSLDDSPLLIFQGFVAGKYRITVSQNSWSKELQPTIEKAAVAKIPAIDLSRLKSLGVEFSTKYPYAEATAEITVAGTVVIVPDPKPDPVVPVVTVGKRQFALIRESKDQGPEMFGTIMKFRNGLHTAWLTQKGHTLIVDDDDSRTGMDWLSLAPGVSAPAIVIVDPSKPGISGVLYAGPAPMATKATDPTLTPQQRETKSAQAIADLVKKYGG